MVFYFIRGLVTDFSACPQTGSPLATKEKVSNHTHHIPGVWSANFHEHTITQSRGGEAEHGVMYFCLKRHLFQKFGSDKGGQNQSPWCGLIPSQPLSLKDKMIWGNPLAGRENGKNVIFYFIRGSVTDFSACPQTSSPLATKEKVADHTHHIPGSVVSQVS